MSAADLNWWKLLPLGALKCPKDKQKLHWETLCGMRVRVQTKGGHVYRAMCPKCNKEYDVLARQGD